MMSYSLNQHNFQMKAGMNVKIGSYTKFFTQNKILATKTQNFKEQNTSVSAPLILKRWDFLSIVERCPLYGSVIFCHTVF